MRIAIDNLAGIDRLADRFRAVAHPDARPLMVTWQRIIEADNRRGVLAGLDRDGRPMAPVTYRPIGTPLRLTDALRGGVRGNRRGVPQGLGAARNGNLTSAQYRRLGGPPLAPRGRYSRVVTNLETDYHAPGGGAGQWEAYGYWREVVSVRGDKFLQYHFHGIGQKKRDLAGVRPEGIAEARRSAVAWIIDIVRSAAA